MEAGHAGADDETFHLALQTLFHLHYHQLCVSATASQQLIIKTAFVNSKLTQKQT
jgi:hypothetical protein